MTSPARRRCRAGSGFTLIELIVVVAVVAVISAIVVPAVLGRMKREPEAARIEQAPPRTSAIGEGRPPAMERADVKIAIAARAVMDGFEVISKYRARFEGRFVVRNRDAERIGVVVPFPPGLSEARDVALRLERDGVAIAEPEDVRYETSGISWTMALPPGEAVTVIVSYEGVGRDALRYDVAGEGRSGEVHVAIDVEGADAVVPVDALEPTGALRWDYQNLVTERPIVVELSPGAAPLGRAIELLRLAGVAVLVFGAGFWYLSALERRGRLDRFRWGHFLLLALDYMLWFAIAAALVARGAGPVIAATAASVIALPLLGLHVARMVDRRFALLRALPLATGTLVGVMASVEDRGAVIAIALVVVAVGLTLTYRTLLLRGEEERARQQAEEDARRAKLEAARALEAAREIEVARERRRRSDGSARCAACGESGATTPFCAGCGTARPIRLPCGCGASMQLAPHLLAEGWQRREVHCTSCGERLAA